MFRDRSVVHMGYGGVVLAAAVAALILLVLPYLVDRRTAITQSREFDRFSPRMRLLRASRPVGSRGSQRTTGGNMSSLEEPARRPSVRARAHSADAERIRDIARLRARRAARLSRERAAGRRRMVMSAVLAVATAAVAALAAASLLAWAWVAVPAALLLVELAASRHAAVVSQRASAEEGTRLRDLRRGLSDAARESASASASATAGSSASVSSASSTRAAPAGRPVASPVTAVAADPAADRPDASTGENKTGESPSSPEVAEPERAEQTPDGASPERRTWTVPRVPAPAYASRERVRGRAVHPDTDIRGIPQVAAHVPARPVTSEGTPVGARSTADIVADQPVAFDLDAVLDARRAE